MLHFLAGSLLKCFDQRPIHISIDDRRMNVALAANSPGVAQPLRHRFDSPKHILLRLCAGIEIRNFLQRFGRQHRAVPRAEILRREFLPRDLLQIMIDVRGGDVHALAVMVDVFKKLLPRQMLTGRDDFRKNRIIEVDVMIDARFSAELKMNMLAMNFNVRVADRGEAERIIVAGVFLIADADERFFEELHERGKNFFARQSFELEVAFGRPANFGKRFPKGNHAVEFRFIARLPPQRVITVLLAFAGIDAGSLDVSVIGGANPDAGPCGRDDEGADTVERGGVADFLPVGITEGKIRMLPFARDSRTMIVDIPQSRGGGEVLRIENMILRGIGAHAGRELP